MRRILIDTDTASDDAIALVLALRAVRRDRKEKADSNAKKS